MGKLLQVRVSAATWDEGEVAKRWPALCALVWPEPAAPASAAAGFAPPARGVLELAAVLRDGLRFGGWPGKTAEYLRPDIERIARAQDALNEALAVWDARGANRWSEDLEAALDQAEDELRRNKF